MLTCWDAALDSAALHVNADAPPLSGVALEALAKEYIAVEGIFARLANRYDENVLRDAGHLPEVTRRWRTTSTSSRPGRTSCRSAAESKRRSRAAER